MRILRFTCLILFLNSMTSLGQTIDGAFVYLDSVCYYRMNFIQDTIVYNKFLNSNDTVVNCSYHRKLIYREMKTDSVYAIHDELMMTGKTINGQKQGIWEFYNYNKDIEFYCWERSCFVNRQTLFNGYVIGNSYFIEQFEIDELRNSFKALINTHDKNDMKLKLICSITENGDYQCSLLTESNKTVKEFSLLYWEDELNLLLQGYYNHKIKQLQRQ